MIRLCEGNALMSHAERQRPPFREFSLFLEEFDSQLMIYECKYISMLWCFFPYQRDEACGGMRIAWLTGRFWDQNGGQLFAPPTSIFMTALFWIEASSFCLSPELSKASIQLRHLRPFKTTRHLVTAVKTGVKFLTHGRENVYFDLRAHDMSYIKEIAHNKNQYHSN